MAHWICRVIASEREFMVFVMVPVAAAAFLAIRAITAWMSLVGPKLPMPLIRASIPFLPDSGRGNSGRQSLLSAFSTHQANDSGRN
jgi:hypothetical protein